MRVVRAWTFASLCMLASSWFIACSGAPNTDGCGVVGREQVCPCEAGAIGIQACQLDGTWEPCTCYPLSAGSSGAAGRSSNAGAAAGSGGTGLAGRTGFPGFLNVFAGRGGAAGRRP